MTMKPFLLLGFLVLLALPAYAGKRDPLSEAEVEQLREATEDPEKRFKLLVQFTRLRITAIEQLHANGKPGSERGTQIHDLLEDFNTLAEELQDNLDMYGKRRNDLRKALKQLVEAYSEWQLKLRTLKETAAAEELKKFDFVLQTAQETLADGIESARDLLQTQLQAAEDKKKKK
jgi:phage-related minor tail protein